MLRSAEEEDLFWVWNLSAARADDLLPVTAIAREGMTLETLTSPSSVTSTLEIARFEADGQPISVRCSAFLAQRFVCELWSVGTGADGAPTERLLFGTAEALACREGDAHRLLADKPGIGRWQVTLPSALVPPEVALPACDAVRAPAEPPVEGKRKRR
jgi:hypothetical protein